jgi:hypothetical protein
MNPTVPTIDPATRFALAYLRRHLTDSTDFSIDAIGAILEHVRTEGTIDGARFVRPDEIDALTEVYISAFPEVPYDLPEWGEPEVIMPDAPDFAVTQRPGYWEALAADGIGSWPPIDGEDERWSRMPPIDGGADDHFEPSEQDWKDYENWARTTDYLSRFNEERNDSSESTA